MIRKLIGGVCCAAVATLAVAGCSDSDDQVNAYAKRVCDQVQSQQQTIKQANDDIAAVSAAGSSPSDVQKADAGAFGRIAGAYQALAHTLRSAGAPPVKDGATLQKNAVTQLTTTATSYGSLQKTVQGLDSSDQGKFADGLKQVSTQLGALPSSGDDALTKLQAGDIGKAMAKQPGCQKPTASASTAPSPS